MSNSLPGDPGLPPGCTQREIDRHFGSKRNQRPSRDFDDREDEFELPETQKGEK